MSMIEPEDLANLQERKYSTTKTAAELLVEWEDLVDELSDKEVALYEWKSIYSVKAMEIENTVDFKALYGKNNADVRKRHIEGELAEWHSNIKDLEFSIDWITRRISFIRELVKVKRTLIEVKQ